jgi:hypothetical protein
MALDLSMFRQNPLRSAAEYEGDYQKLDLNRQTLGLNQQKLHENALAMRDKQQAAAEAAQIKNALAGLGPQSSVEQRVQVLRSFGTPGALKLANEEIAAADVSRSSRVGSEGKELKLRTDKLAATIASIASLSNSQEAEASIRESEAKGEIPKAHADSMVADLAKTPFGQWQRKSLLRALEAKEQLEATTPVAFTQDLGGSVGFGAKDKMTGMPTWLGETPKTAPPVNPETERHNREMEAAAYMRAQRTGEGKETVKPVTIEDPDEPGAMITIDANKQPGQVGYRIGGAGKTSKRAADMAEASGAIRSANQILDTIETEYAKLAEGNDIVSSDRSAVGNVMTRLGASDLGQLVQGGLGTKAQTARDNIEGSRNLLLTAVKAAGNLTGREVDTNKDVQRWMTVVTNPKSSKQSADYAIKQLREFIGTRSEAKASGGNPGGKPAANSAPSGVDPEDWKHMTPQERALWTKP